MIARLCLLLTCLGLLSCGRPPSEGERQFLTRIHGPELDLDRLRIVKGAPLSQVTFRRKPRPRVTCRERILPPVKEEIVTSSPAALALFNRIFFVRDWYIDDYMPAYPDRLYLVEAMLLAHEATHVWQWQQRAKTGYHPLRAAAEHRVSDDPYLFDLKGNDRFIDFAYEQQGAIVEEYVCCRALDPTGARTKRLHRMLKGAMPVSDLPQSRESDVYLPWKDVDVTGICA
ncbi:MULTISPECIES: hypothetical protein [Phaeobacter]|uniref:hypothetical protein n=1 Tax=Phaeobacter TaxID=302485 RepID=UPI00058BA049|nr:MULTISPECIES: hypothetical protein [Phaeobacter]ATG40040.1 hypothetical protein PhaeoP14_01949 [Phaeobacter piscinae]KII14798.1 hypothetical protein OO25_10420 [Phaeobacter sp. S60]UTS81068.1 hypothetical protein OL67_002144 [Phaeobacter piscinae]